jgi:ribonuclease HII
MAKATPTINLHKFDASFGRIVCGIDEVGRGPLAGPVVAACAVIPTEHIGHAVWRSVNDSKKLTHNKREFLFDLIRERCIYSIAEASVEEVDTLNIHHATLLAMKRAFEGVQSQTEVSLALIDGKFAPKLDCTTQTVVKGDATSLSIAAASILAKVTRDRMMGQLHVEHPYYGWAGNAGYGTPEHMAGIKAHGITIHHRRSFAPCRDKAA